MANSKNIPEAQVKALGDVDMDEVGRQFERVKNFVDEIQHGSHPPEFLIEQARQDPRSFGSILDLLDKLKLADACLESAAQIEKVSSALGQYLDGINIQSIHLLVSALDVFQSSISQASDTGIHFQKSQKGWTKEGARQELPSTVVRTYDFGSYRFAVVLYAENSFEIYYRFLNQNDPKLEPDRLISEKLKEPLRTTYLRNLLWWKQLGYDGESPVDYNTASGWGDF